MAGLKFRTAIMGYKVMWLGAATMLTTRALDGSGWDRVGRSETVPLYTPHQASLLVRLILGQHKDSRVEVVPVTVQEPVDDPAPSRPIEQDTFSPPEDAPMPAPKAPLPALPAAPARRFVGYRVRWSVHQHPAVPGPGGSFGPDKKVNGRFKVLTKGQARRLWADLDSFDRRFGTKRDAKVFKVYLRRKPRKVPA